MLFIPHNIILNDIMQNLLNLSVYPTRGFFYLSVLLISNYTVHFFVKLVKRKLQEKLLFSRKSSRFRFRFNASTYN
jgi:hypothetical protein